MRVSPGKWLRTARHLKARQWLGRLTNPLRRPFAVRPLRPGFLTLPPFSPPAQGWSADPFPKENLFKLLNREKHFSGKVEWGFQGFGPLWHYTLNSFDWELPAGGPEPGLNLMESFLAGLDHNPLGLDPWPTSRRIVNWIRQLERQGVDPRRRGRLAAAIKDQAYRLSHRLEYHLLGNHLVENGLALLWAGAWLKDRRLLTRASSLLSRQLRIQILSDGGHEERSTMYHCRLLDGLLDALDLARRNRDRGISSQLVRRIAGTADAMLGWARALAFRDGGLPLVNDSAPGGFPPLQFLAEKAHRLGLKGKPRQLGASGYRRLEAEGVEALIDVGPPGPDHNPGHGHCDALAVIIRTGGIPLLVDPGVSAYHDPAVRMAERGTAAHNTVVVNGEEQNEIWGTFRMGRRAAVRDLEESEGLVAAAHTGYAHLGVRHHRSLAVRDREIRILDRVDGDMVSSRVAWFHFPPEMELVLENDQARWPGGEIHWRGGAASRVAGHVSAGFNRREGAPVVRVDFSGTRELETRILVNR